MKQRNLIAYQEKEEYSYKEAGLGHCVDETQFFVFG